MGTISIIIPSAKDPYLQKTIDDIRLKSEGDVEIIVVLDGTWDNVMWADKVLFNPKREGMRNSVNRGVAASSGDYIMKCDAHCMFGEGFDTKLLTQIEDNWLVIPRRYKFNPDKWEIIDGPPTDYDRLMISNPKKLTGVSWASRDRERANRMIDETMVHQGSCYLMSRKHWDWLGGLQTEGYGSLMQESIETSLKTWLGGGKVMVNKLTWYAHKDRLFKRTVFIDPKETEACYAYSKDFWLNNRWDKRIHDLEWLMKRFGVEYNPAL